MAAIYKGFKIRDIKIPTELGMRPTVYEKFGKYQKVLYGLECAQD